MVWIGEKEIKMHKGWVVLYKDGTIICEDEKTWKKLPNHKDIQRVILKWEDRIWSLDDKEYYTVPKTRGFMDVSTGGVSQGIDSRTIGYYDMKEKCRVYLRVDEITGRMTMETESF